MVMRTDIPLAIKSLTGPGCHMSSHIQIPIRIFFISNIQGFLGPGVKYRASSNIS